MIKCQGIEKKFNENIVLGGLDLHVPENRISLLVGTNGCGKSTLLKIIASLVKEDKGEIYFSGKNKNSNPTQYKKDLSYLPQEINIFDQMTIRDIEDFYLSINNILNPNIVLRDIFKINTFDNKTFSSLSGGMKQKFMLSLIFMKNPKIIILDEPFNSLDIKAINDLTDYLVSLKRQKTILIASHYFNKLESLVDKLFIMDEGIIVQEENLSSSNSDKTNINLDRSVSSFFKNYVY